MAEVHEDGVELSGLRIAYRRYGPTEAQPVLCLHGWLDNAASFAPLAEHMPDYQLIAPDLAGHGHSDHRALCTPYHHLDWVLDMIAFCDALKLERFALLGHSMGAGIAALLAGTVPERVRHLGLIEGTGPRPTPAAELPTLLSSFHQAEQKARALPIRARPAAFDIAVRARLVSSPLSRGAAELLAQRGTEVVAHSGGRVRWRNDRRLSRMQPMHLGEEQILAFLARIACPTLLVVAREGLRYNAEVVERRKAAISALSECLVDGRHHVHMDHPERVAPQLLALLAQPA
ncbi:MAG: alpha/beta hydrolase [Myxococcales bacterium]|nr:alpha/beta hydrolase [Myxococcales bacterium]